MMSLLFRQRLVARGQSPSSCDFAIGSVRYLKFTILWPVIAAQNAKAFSFASRLIRVHCTETRKKEKGRERQAYTPGILSSGAC